MLSKINRLKNKRDFDRVFKRGKGFKENFLFLKLAKNNLKMSRFGFVVGRNFSLKATLRNKMKNRLREVVRARLPEVKSGFDAILVVQRGGRAEGDYQTIAGTVNRLLKKAELI